MRYIISRIGKTCGFIGCTRKGWLPLYTFEVGNNGFWVSCGHSHKGAN